MQIVNTEQTTGPAGTPEGREYLVFGLGGEEYALGIQQVQELRGYEMVTELANSPDYIKGVINLRGSIVPIIDMRIKFKLGTPTYNAFTVVIILNIGARVVGMVVDGVSDVVTLTPQQIKPAPAMHAATIDTSYLIGMGTLDDRMLILIDIGKLVCGEDLGTLARLAA